MSFIYLFICINNYLKLCTLYLLVLVEERLHESCGKTQIKFANTESNHEANESVKLIKSYL